MKMAEKDYQNDIEFLEELRALIGEILKLGWSPGSNSPLLQSPEKKKEYGYHIVTKEYEQNRRRFNEMMIPAKKIFNKYRANHMITEPNLMALFGIESKKKKFFLDYVLNNPFPVDLPVRFFYDIIDQAIGAIKFKLKEIEKPDTVATRQKYIQKRIDLLHQNVQASSGQLLIDKHYRQAILDAYIGLIQAVQEKSGRTDLDGYTLMQHVFSANNPILRISEYEDDQRGFMNLFCGAVMAIRNPKAHRLIQQPDENRALEWLSFASVLHRVLEGAELVE